MNSDMNPSYFKDDIDFDVMKQFQQPANTTAPANVFGSVWGAENGFPNMTYTPGEYLNDKEAHYEAGFIDPQAPGEFMDWSNNAPSLLNSPISGSMSETPSAYNDLLSPTSLTTPHAAWGSDAFDNVNGSFASMDDAAAVSAAARSGSRNPSVSAASAAAKSKVSKGKTKATHTKSRSRSEVKSKSVSSASSASSAGSVKYSNSGHGGNHHITLRTASRKPKPPVGKPEDGSPSGESSPSSPDATADQLTSEERRARQNHNVVEKQYRNRLNAQFEWLLAVLPANQPDGPDGSRHGEFDDRRMSKAEVLDLARRRIHALEQERKQLHAERKSLLENVSRMQRAVQRQHLATVGSSI